MTTSTPTTAAPDPVRVALTSNQLALLIELGKGRELCHSEDGEIAWLDTARNGDRWFDIDWKDMAALRDAGYLRSAEDHRFHVDLISEAGNRALARAMQEAMSAEGGKVAAWIEKDVLLALAQYKDATGTVCSGLLTKPFGNKVALYARPAPEVDPDAA